MKLITQKDLIPLRNLQVLQIKTSPKEDMMIDGIGILSKMAEYDDETFNNIDLKDVDYMDDTPIIKDSNEE